jgi:hypothetical protein
MHYFGTPPVSADYFGRFAEQLARLIGAKAGGDGPPAVVTMSQGTSGDQHWMDYARPKDSITIDAYAEAVARRALGAYESIAYRPWAALGMVERRLTLRRRVPDEARLAWARPIVAAMGDRAPKNQPEVYAREALYLHEEPERELKLQAIRIGTLGIAAIPDEVYVLTGLKIKARSPLRPTFTIELSNGSEGYIPPPEQHALGGYTTWPARTAGLEVGAEPKIVDAVLGLLESVAGRPRRAPDATQTPYSRAVLAAKPWSFWRLEETEGATAADATGREHRGHLEPGYALYLDGPPTPGAAPARPVSHSVHLAGGRITLRRARVPGTSSSVALWFWNGLPNDARPVTGVLLDRQGPPLRVGLGGGKGPGSGRLFLTAGEASGSGRSEVAPRTWHHLAVIQGGGRVTAYLDGREEASVTVSETKAAGTPSLAIGGGDEVADRFEGKLDEVAVFDRPLSASEVNVLYEAASKAGG